MIRIGTNCKKFIYREFCNKTDSIIKSKLNETLKPSFIDVIDISGGCGSMYKIDIVSSSFIGKSKVHQHRMVNQVLENEIKAMHGLTLKTMTPDEYIKNKS